MKNNLITSKEILEKAGISRATLNNYIKCGILPRPLVSNPGSDQEGVKQIGYFPMEALQWIKQVKALKRSGKSMEIIAGMFQNKDWVDTLQARQEKTTNPKQQSNIQQTPPRRRRNSEQNGLKVTIENITSPAYLVNNNLEIEWINEQAEQVIFHREINSICNVESRNIFKLLLAPSLQNSLRNWNDLVGLHCTLLQRNIDHHGLTQAYAGITDDETALLSDAYLKRLPPATDNLYRLPFSITGKIPDSRESFFVHSETYREGTFIVFVPADQDSSSIIDTIAQREKIINELLNNRMPSMVSLCTLVASLQDSERLCAQMLPSLYFKLINDLWQTTAPVFEKYYGTYGQHAGNEMIYYFTRRHDEEYLSDTINCATELRTATRLFSRRWCRENRLAHKIELNIGLHEGREFFGTIHSGGNVEFTALGDSVKVARRLAAFAVNGEIWATKDLVSKLPACNMNDYSFGVHRDRDKPKVSQLNSFSLASDLIPPGTIASHALEPISNIAITEIQDSPM